MDETNGDGCHCSRRLEDKAVECEWEVECSDAEIAITINSMM